MFLEVNSEALIIVGRASFVDEDRAAWRELCKTKQCVILAEPQDGDAWLALADVATIVPWNPLGLDSVATNIKCALERYGREPHEALYVCSNPDDLRSAISTRVGTSLLRSGARAELPDLFLNSVDDLLDALNAKADDANGYLGETTTTRSSYGRRGGRGGRIIRQSGYLQGRMDLDPELATNIEIAFLGRYFTDADERHDKHQYTHRVLRAKRGYPGGEIVASPLGGAIANLHSALGIDLVTRVPPKVDAADDHIGALVKAAAQRADKRFHTDLLGSVELDAIRCVRALDAQKTAGSWTNRARNVSGAFAAANSVRARHVLVVDDVLTSGATAVESVRALLAAGAEAVTVLALAVAQHVVTRIDGQKLQCPSCGAPLQLRFARKTNDGFFGCPGFPNCQGMLPYKDGLTRLNAMTRSSAINAYKDIGF